MLGLKWVPNLPNGSTIDKVLNDNWVPLRLESDKVNRRIVSKEKPKISIHQKVEKWVSVW